MKVKKGDKVIILSGDDKGKTGEIIKSMPKENKVVVQGVNVVKRHQKPSQTNPGGIISKELPINASKVALVDAKTGKPTRVGYAVDKKNNKVRVARKSGEVIDK